MKFRKPCQSPGCPALVTDTRYCPKHADKERQSGRDYDARRKDDPALAAAAAFRSSPEWQRLRRLIIARNPLCADPFGRHERHGQTVASREVHHVVPLVVDQSLAMDGGNLMPLCAGCHARLERQTERHIS